MSEQESKDATESFIKLKTNVICTHMFAKSGILKIGEKSVAAMIK